MAKPTAMQALLVPGEEKARKMLLGGAGLLVLGLALVGVGQGTMGSVPVLAGLVTTIAAIHVYGRLGPDEVRPEEAAVEEAPRPGRSRRTKARVEKRRRMDKSPAP
jgi:hypothetical protein